MRMISEDFKNLVSTLCKDRQVRYHNVKISLPYNIGFILASKRFRKAFFIFPKTFAFLKCIAAILRKVNEFAFGKRKKNLRLYLKAITVVGR